MPNDNPYRSGGHSDFLIERAQVLELADLVMRTDRGLVLLGGHGSGKTTALHQIEQVLISRRDVAVLRFPDEERSEDSCHIRICLALEWSYDDNSPNCSYALRGWLKANPGKRLVLLFDEFGSRLPDAGRKLFDLLEVVRKDNDRRLAIMLAGGVSLMRFEMGRGSPFWSRALLKIMRPFSAGEIALLAGPLRERRALAPEVLETIRALTGGNAYLTTYTLQRLWDCHEIDVGAVLDLLADEEGLAPFKDAFESALQVRRPGHPIRRMWDYLVSTRGPHDLSELERVCLGSTPSDVKARNALHFLKAAGLVRGQFRGSKVDVAIVPSILQPPRPISPTDGESTLQQLLDRELEWVLLEIHGNGLDFHETEGAKEAKRRVLVYEALFSALVSIVLKAKGWQTEREPQRAAGRLDVLARHPGFPNEHAVIELKIWGRKRYKQVGEQAAGYHQRGASAFAAVTLSSRRRVDAWRADFEEKCLRGKWKLVPIEPPIAGCYRAELTTSDGAQVMVTHLLLRVPG